MCVGFGADGEAAKFLPLHVVNKIKGWMFGNSYFGGGNLFLKEISRVWLFTG
jgi:hypothetical protein